MCPSAGRLLNGFFPKKLVCHCFLIESANGLLLVDAGLGVNDLKHPKKLGPMSRVLGVQANPEDAAINQIKKLGFDPKDVRHIVPTHLDFDHAGGIVDFPQAKIHTLDLEYNMAINAKSITDKQRYKNFLRNQSIDWVVHKPQEGEKWFGFEAVRDIPGLPPEILLIPLFGHTPGHFGVAVQTPEGWVLHVGDAYYDRRSISKTDSSPLGMKIFERFVHMNYSQAIANQARLQKLVSDHSDEIKVVSSHDVHEFENCRTDKK